MNKVILIGGSHHNGLGLAGSFGINGIKPYGVIVGKDGKSFITKSKYWQETWVLEDEKKAVDFIITNFSDEKEKPVIIPWSDSAAAEIDNNLNRLLPNFIAPSLGERQGEIVKMMDKQNQIDFLKKYDLPMASTWTVALPYAGNGEEFIFPCICKPVSSYEGLKTDIRKIDCSKDLQNYFAELTAKGYKRILVQEFIHFDRELVFVGACDNNPAYIISQNIREWPIVGGTNSYFQVINDKSAHDVCRILLSALRKEGYFGLFDIELFQVCDRILINEINWRNTGNSFFALGTGVHYAVTWYKNAIGHDTASMRHSTDDETQFAMNEATDFRHVVFKGLSPVRWFRDLKRTKSFALWYGKDLRPTFIRYVYLLKELVLRRHHG